MSRAAFALHDQPVTVMFHLVKDVVLSFPANSTPESFEDLKAHLADPLLLGRQSSYGLVVGDTASTCGSAFLLPVNNRPMKPPAAKITPTTIIQKPSSEITRSFPFVFIPACRC